MRYWLLRIAGTYVQDCTACSFSGGSRNTAKRFATWREAVDFTIDRFPDLPFSIEVAAEDASVCPPRVPSEVGESA